MIRVPRAVLDLAGSVPIAEEEEAWVGSSVEFTQYGSPAVEALRRVVKGRYGSAVGRAVHGVLQSVDLRTGAGLEDAVAAQCLAEGAVEFTDLVTALGRSALAHDVVRRAAEREHWRESYVGTVEEDGTVLEGFVDLIYREDDGSLVIVDYKTDDIPDAAIPARTAYYQPQLDAYERVLVSAVDGQLIHGRLAFLAAGSL